MRVHRLRQMVVEARRECPLAVFEASEGRHGEGGDPPLVTPLLAATQSPQEAVAVLSRHADVGHDDIGATRRHGLSGGGAGFHGAHHCTVLFEQARSEEHTSELQSLA